MSFQDILAIVNSISFGIWAVLFILALKRNCHYKGWVTRKLLSEDGRTILLLLLVSAGIAAFFATHNRLFTTVYWIVVNGLLADDLITGCDSDRWKRRWESVKNKVKWVVPKPAPRPALNPSA